MKKYLFIIAGAAIALSGVFFSVPQAHALRLDTIGFELATTTLNTEISILNLFGSPSVSGTVTSTLAHGGTWSYDFKTTSNTNGVAEYKFSAGASTTFTRAYVYIKTLPNNSSTIFGVIDAANDGVYGGVYITPSGQIGVEYTTSGPTVQYSTNTIAIATGTWNDIEVELNTVTANTQIVNAQVNGVALTPETGSATLAKNTNAYVGWGGSIVDNNSSTQEYLFDDIAINDNSSSTQNSWPGQGTDILYRPNGPGDKTNWRQNSGNTSSTTNWTLVSENPPDGATSFVSGSSTVMNDLYTVSSTAVLPSTAAITLVQPGFIFARSAATGPAFKLQIEQRSAGTVASSSAITPTATTFTTNALSAPFNPPITMYKDPTNTAWTTSTISTMEIGEIITTAGTTGRGEISSIWAYTEYVPTSTAPNATSISTTVNGDGGRSGDSITISGSGFGTALQGSRATCSGGGIGTGCIQFVVGGTATVPDANVTAWSNTSITFTVPATLVSNGGASAVTVWAGGLADATPLTFYIYPKISSIVSVGTNAAREYNAADTDGLIMLVGDHFGTTTGTSTILGSSATIHSSIAGSCSVASFTSTTVCLEVPAAIANNNYSGTIIVNRASDNKQATTSLSILSRILTLSPTTGGVATLVQILGDHLCQSGTCPTSPNRSVTNNHVAFGSVTSTDSDFIAQSGGAGACNGSGAAWTDSEICVQVPALGVTGGATTIVTSNGNTTNSAAFTITGPVAPAAPGTPTYSSIASTTLTVSWTASPTSSAAISLVQSTSTSLGNTANEADQFKNAVAKGDLLIVGSMNLIGDNITASDNLGDTFVKIAVADESSDHDSYIWVATTTAAGADQITLADATQAGIYGMSIHEYSGTPLGSIATIIDATSTNSDPAITSMSTGNVTTHAANDLVFSYFTTGNDNPGNTMTFNPNFTKREPATGVTDCPWNGGSTCLGSSDETVASAGTVNATATLLSGDHWTGAAVAIFATAGAGAGTSSYYKIERATSSQVFVQISTTTSLNYNDTGLTGNTTYFYRVRGTNGGGDSPYSASSSVLTLPNTPGTPTFTSVGTTTLTVNWTAPTGGASYYKIERAPDSSGSPGSFAQISTTTSLSYGDTGLSQATTYWYRIRATNATGDGSYSGNASTTTSSTSGGNLPPVTPVEINPASGIQNVSQSPVFNMSSTDPDGNGLQYKVTIYSNSLCTTAVQTDDQSASQTGWSGQNASSSKEYTSGTQGTFTVQSPLGTNTTYYWKASAKDPDGSNTWTDSATCNSFITTFGNWTSDSGTWSINSNALTVTPASGSSVQIRLSGFTPSSDIIEFKAKSSGVGANSGNVAGIIRADSGANRYNLAMADFLNQRAVIGKKISSVYSALTSSSITFSASTYAEFRGSISGTSLQSWTNGGNALSTTDSGLSSGGVGLEASSTNGSATFTFDDFAVYTGTTVTMASLPAGGCWAIENKSGTIIASSTGGTINLAAYTGQIPVDYDNGGGTVAVWTNSTCTGAADTSNSFGPSYSGAGDGIFGGDAYSYTPATGGTAGTVAGTTVSSSSVTVNSVGQVSY